MSARELKLDDGLTRLRVNDAHGGDLIALIIEQSPAFKGDTTGQSMLAMLDRNQQHLLMLYLHERLK